MWKLLVLIAGLAGVAGFFLPLRSLASPDGKITAQASAYEIVIGLDDTKVLFDQATKLGLDKETAARMSRNVNQAIEAYRYTMLALFIPSALLVLLAALGFAKGGLGRFAGLLAIVLGLASGVAFAAILFLVGDLVIDEQAIKLTLSSSNGLGMYCLLATGVLASLAGLGALLRPDDQ